jgi:hypothetical protein
MHGHTILKLWNLMSVFYSDNRIVHSLKGTNPKTLTTIRTEFYRQIKCFPHLYHLFAAVLGSLVAKLI